MNTAASNLGPFHLAPETEGQCRVAVVYENTPSRERAVQLSHRLVQTFWAQIEFEFSWWRFRFLVNAEIAEAAAVAAGRADIIIFSVEAAHVVPSNVTRWAEAWMRRSRISSGVFVPLIELNAASTPLLPWGLSRVIEMARSAGLDCVWPDGIALPVADPSSLAQRRMQRRADETTRVLEGILHHRYTPPPMHWGINE
jgi:hypothetical protein